MKKQVLRRKHKNMNGVHETRETAITRGGRVKESVTLTERLNNKGDFHVVTETVYKKATPTQISNLKKNRGTTAGAKKKAAVKKKTTAAKKRNTPKKTGTKRKTNKKPVTRKKSTRSTPKKRK